MKESVLRDNKSYAFAIRIVKLSQYLVEKKNAWVLSKQLLRSGTSIGALVRESEHAESPADFGHKLNIALKEVNETLYWLSLLRDTNPSAAGPSFELPLGESIRSRWSLIFVKRIHDLRH